MQAPRHFSVMLRESLEYLAIKPDGNYGDLTCGLGGHTCAIASLLTGGGKLISNDRDAQSLGFARERAAEWADRIEFRHGSFTQMAQNPPTGLDGVMADLGISLHQLTNAERGFSFRNDGALDMRMDQSQGITADDLVNYEPEKSLADILFYLGEERRARKIARAIVKARPLRSTLHLAGTVAGVIAKTGPTHPATKTFMALRMKVNREQEELDSLLEMLPKMVKPGGRIVVISFMSLEDRKVKDCFRKLATEGGWTLLTKKPLEPSEDEVRENPPSRSAKMRVVERTAPIKHAEDYLRKGPKRKSLAVSPQA